MKKYGRRVAIFFFNQYFFSIEKYYQFYLSLCFGSKTALKKWLGSGLRYRGGQDRTNIFIFFLFIYLFPPPPPFFGGWGVGGVGRVGGGGGFLIQIPS